MSEQLHYGLAGGHAHRRHRCSEGDTRPGVWQHPTDRRWLCAHHAPPIGTRARCAVEGCPNVGAWRHPHTYEWLCVEHM